MTTIRALSGLAGSPELWRGTIEQLADRLPGSTMSVTPVPWDATGTDGWAEPGWAPQEIIDPLVRPGEILVAHSLAASLTLAHLCDPHRRQPAGAVLISPFYRPRAADFSWGSLEHFLLHFHEFLETGLVARSPRQIDPDIRLDMARAVRDRMGAYGWMAFMSAYLATPGLATAAASLPVTVVYGTHDEVAPPADARALAEALPAAEVCPVAGADHFPMSADPAAVADAITATAHRATAPLTLAPRS